MNDSKQLLLLQGTEIEDKNETHITMVTGLREGNSKGHGSTEQNRWNNGTRNQQINRSRNQFSNSDRSQQRNDQEFPCAFCKLIGETIHYSNMGTYRYKTSTWAHLANHHTQISAYSG